MKDQTITTIPNLGYHPARQYSIITCRWLAWMVIYVLYDMLKTEVRFDWKITPWTVTIRTHSVWIPWMLLAWLCDLLSRSTHRHLSSPPRHDLRHCLRADSPPRTRVKGQRIYPLNPRDSLYGGHTYAIRLFCTGGDMCYVDVCSLYPYVLKYRPFPVGHPEILIDNFGNLGAYFGVIKCRVLPHAASIIPSSLMSDMWRTTTESGTRVFSAFTKSSTFLKLVTPCSKPILTPFWK